MRFGELLHLKCYCRNDKIEISVIKMIARVVENLISLLRKENVPKRVGLSTEFL